MILNIILIVIILLLIYAVINLLRKNEKLEEVTERNETFINSISSVIQESNYKLSEIDTKGSFEADDEIGFFFKNVKLIQSMLNKYILENEKNT